MLKLSEILSILKEDFKGNKIAFAIKVLMLLIPAGLLAVLILAAFVRWGFFGVIPSQSELEKIKNPVASEIYSKNEVLIGKYFYENRTNISFDLFPEELVDALVATEDARFWKHSGVDWRSLGRVFFRTLLLRDRSGGGGSTITQQLVKNLFKRKHYPIIGIPVIKLREMFIAKRLEKVYSKKEILELYMNTIPFGHNFYGLEVASRRYFGKSASRLKTEESATLVGMLKANTYFNPALNPERSKDRRNTVFQQMNRYGYIDQSMLDSLKQLPLELNFTLENHATGRATHFRQMLKLEVEKIINDIKKSDGQPYDIHQDGLKIHTTIDEGMQEYAEAAMREHMIQLQAEFDAHWKGKSVWKKKDHWTMALHQTGIYKKLKKAGLTEEEVLEEMSKKKRMKVYTPKGPTEKEWSSIDSLNYYLQQLRAGFLVLESGSGAVLAWVGGTDYQFFQYDHILSKRQVGSTFKPFLYYSAYSNGFLPCDFKQNLLATYLDYDDWTPRNADDNYTGWYSYKGALTNSVNTVSASLILNNGIRKTIKAAKKLGWDEKLEEIPSLALGTAENSLINLLAMYNTLMNNGSSGTPHFVTKITDRKGEVLYENELQIEDENIDTVSAQLVRATMQNVVDNGTATRLKWKYNLDVDVAGKTGTTQSGADGWFIGCTPEIIAGAWVGGEYPFISFRTGNYGQGAHMALPIWAKFFQRLKKSKRYSGLTRTKFPALDSTLVSAMDCPDFLSDSLYLERQERLKFEEDEESFQPILNEIFELLTRDKTDRKEIPGTSKKNERILKKRERKNKRKKFFEELFKD